MIAALWLAIAGCGAGPEVAAPAATEAPVGGTYWTCPMHPSVHQDHPGSCPICGMDLTEVDPASGGVQVDPARRERFGIALEAAAIRTLTTRVRMPAVVGWDPTGLTDVSVRVAGWVSGATAAPGDAVRAGQTLFSLYSPELVAAEDDLLRAAQATDPGAAARRDAARLRLARFGVDEGEIERIVARGTVEERVPFRAPRAGFVLERTAVDGAMVGPGQTLYRLGNTARVWLEAAVPAASLPQIHQGQAVTVQADERLAGTVHSVLPGLDPTTRTARARIVLDNPRGALHPDQWVTVVVAIDAGEALAVPESAVLYTGPRRVVFVEGEGDALVPREVTIGQKADGYVQILDGLAVGERVVRSGSFLVAADARLQQGASR